MARPIYASAGEQPGSRISGGHAGLWFDKFCNTWRAEGSFWTMSSPGGSNAANPKTDWIRSLTGSRVGVLREIEELAQRVIRLVNARGGRYGVFTTESRFVTGLGRSHPVENGFAWHPSLGTPFLPGTSVKGLVRAWAELEASPQPDPATLSRLLGEAGSSGQVVFMDALPLAPVTLEADVMTPHYGGWTPDDPPGDWRSPTPIPFLAAAAGTSFLLGVVPRDPHGADAADLGAVWDWLCPALEWSGGGAKTAVGYGRFLYDQRRTEEWADRIEREDAERREKRQRQQLESTPEGRWQLELDGLNEINILEQVRIHLEAEPLDSAEERRDFATAVMTAHGDRVDLWRTGRKEDDQNTRHGARRLRALVRLLDSALEG